MFQVSSIEEISRFKKQSKKRRIENPLKISMFLAIDFIQNQTKFDQNSGLEKRIQKHTENIDFPTVWTFQNPPKTTPKSTKKQRKIDVKNEREKMRENERQERPRPPEERAMKSSMRDIPPALLRPVAPRRDRKALDERF